MQTLFYILMFLWLFSEIYYAITLRSGNTDKKGSDKSSFVLLWVVIALSIFFSIGVSKNVQFTILNRDWISYLGAFLLLLGVVARYFIIRDLGKYFTVDVTIREDHKIKKDGFYKYVRHPSYAFSLLTFVGLGLFLDNWLSLAIAFIPTFITFSYRIFVEEKTLTDQFGEEYQNYKKQTKKLIPFIY